MKINRLKPRKALNKAILKVKPNRTEIDIDGITNKIGMIRKTAHNYPQMLTGQFGQVRDVIIVESAWLGHFEPYSIANVSSFVYEMMLQNNQQQLIEEYGMNPFEVKVLNPERTLCEKIMSLVRFSQTQDPIGDLRNKIRHIYDIHLMLQNDNLNSIFKLVTLKKGDYFIKTGRHSDRLGFIQTGSQFPCSLAVTQLLFEQIQKHI